MLFLMFVIGALLGMTFAAAVCVRLVRTELLARLGPQLELMTYVLPICSGVWTSRGPEQVAHRDLDGVRGKVVR